MGCVFMKVLIHEVFEQLLNNNPSGIRVDVSGGVDCGYNYDAHLSSILQVFILDSEKSPAEQIASD